MSGQTLVQMLDTRTETYIQQVKEASSQYVAEKVKDALFLDPERYGVDAEGRRVKIYLNNSQIMERAFKLATGLTIDQFIQNLPIGVRHLAGAFKSRLENMIATQLVGKLSELSVGRPIERVLLQGYGYAKQAIADRIDARYQDGSDRNPHLEAVLSDSNLQAVIAKAASEQDLSQGNEQDDLQNINHLNHQHTITLKDVLGRCEYQLKCYLNGLAQDATAYAIKKGLRSVSEAAMEKTFDYSTSFVATTGAAATLLGANPALGVASLAGSQLANQLKPAVVKSTGDKAEACAEEWIKQSDLYQRELIALDHAKSGQYLCVEEQDEDSELADDNEWSVVAHNAYSFTEWAKGKLHQMKDYFVWQANQRTSEVQVVTRNWFRDNDFDKLDKIRETYVAGEKKLIALELELMEATEYARGQRETVTAEGLQMWRERTLAIAEEAKQALAEMRATVGRVSGIENLSRKQGIVTAGEQVVVKLSKNLTELTNSLPKLWDEAAPQIKANRVVAR